ncbi:alpha-amylase-domain-containing protein [Clavulina sp. PMI_390]|nr:alpha-amylase-domain-containing protein [Clavulina sp. PMI_390]
MFWATTSLALASILLKAEARPLASYNTSSTGHMRRDIAGSKSVIVQMFEWTWDSIATECTQYLGPAGYGWVQVSPAQEHITGSQWWTDYQPVSYTLTSKRGNRSQYQNMVTACNKAGLQVIADTIFNHMTAQSSGTGVAGDSFTQFNYPGTYQSQDFHYCGLEPNNVIVNYDNRQEVQTCELDGLADLATETEYVRSRLAQYANDLISLGVTGLRLDAAKHIATGDINNILSRLSKVVYITQETIWGSGEPITPSEYVQNGDVQEFRYTSAVKSAFLTNGITGLSLVASDGWEDSSVVNVFVANHDTERNGNSLNYLSPSNTYTLAHAFMLGWPYGTPTVTSGYTWSTTDDGAPNGGAGTCYGNGGVNGWLCTHRWPLIAGMTQFRNHVFGSAVTNYVTGTNEQMAWGRGALGFVAINNADSAWSKTFTTSLPNGVYCDVAAGQPSGTTCAGGKYTVSSGTFTASVPARSAVALHTGALSS